MNTRAGRHTRPSASLAGFLCALASALPAPRAVAQSTPGVTPVARTGQPAPGTTRVFSNAFSPPVINASGHVAFQASLVAAPGTTPFPHGAWAGAPGALDLVTAAGRPAPGTGPGGGPGAPFRTVGWPLLLDAAGRTVFYGNLVQGGDVTFDNDYGMWAGGPAPSAGGLHLLARRGNPAPQLADGSSYGLFFVNANAAGRFGLSALLVSPSGESGADVAAYVGTMPTPDGAGPQVRLVARAGDAAPGLAPGWTFAGLDAPAINATGRIAMSATAAPPKGSTAGGGAGGAAGASPNRRGIWAGTAVDLKPLAVTGDPAPVGGAARAYFQSLGAPRVNGAGRVAFKGWLADAPGDDQANATGLWAGTPADLRPVALEGGVAPGFSPGAVFRGTPRGAAPPFDAFRDPVQNAAGQIAFVATAAGDGIDFGNNDGLWLWGDAGPGPGGASALRLIAREGESAPGRGDGTRFAGRHDDEDYTPAFQDPLLNEAGMLAFVAETLDAAGRRAAGIWAAGPTGVLRLVAAEGDRLELAPGDVRTVTQLSIHTGAASEQGQSSALNDAGQLAFLALFTDGTQAVLITTVPEPGAAAVLALIALFPLRRARRSRAGRVSVSPRKRVSLP